MRGYPKYIATKQDYINLLSLSDNFNTLTQVKAEQPVKDGGNGKMEIGTVSLEPMQVRASALLQTRAENSKELNDILDVCTAAATPDDFRRRAIADLAEIWNMSDDTASRTLDIREDGTAVTEEIENSMPLWKIKGFSSRQEIADLIAQYDSGEV